MSFQLCATDRLGMWNGRSFGIVTAIHVIGIMVRHHLTNANTDDKTGREVKGLTDYHEDKFGADGSALRPSATANELG